MPWFKVDDHFHSHRKTLGTSPAALGLWVVAGSWAAANPDDGFVPSHVLPRLLPDAEPLADELVEQRLWMRVRGGFRFRNWAEYQFTKEEVERTRTKARERQRKRRAGLTAQVTADAVTDMSQRDSQRDTTVSHATPTQPNPTQPEVLVTSGENVAVINARGTRLPTDWIPSREDVTWAREHFPAVDSKAETDRFRDHWKAQPGAKGRKSDWHATWRNWIRKAAEYSRPASPSRADGTWSDGNGVVRSSNGVPIAKRGRGGWQE